MIHFSKPCDPLFAVLRRGVAAIVAGALLIAGSAVAQRPTPPTPTPPKEPIVIDSVVANVDEEANTADFTTISVTQGDTRVTAEQAHATGLGSKNSRWIFTGRVMITSELRRSLSADQATFEYRDGELAQVVATGSPARFEQRRTDIQGVEHGQADKITYDAKQRTARLQGHAQLSDGKGMDLSAPMFVYHVRDGKLQAYSESGERAVHITTKPTGSLVLE
jgi:lipopolysaccharide export system protein LptA